MIERKKETAAGRYDFRNEHSRFTGLSNNAVLKKRHLSFRPKRSGVENGAAGEAATWTGRPEAERAGASESNLSLFKQSRDVSTSLDMTNATRKYFSGTSVAFLLPQQTRDQSR